MVLSIAPSLPPLVAILFHLYCRKKKGARIQAGRPNQKGFVHTGVLNLQFDAAARLQGAGPAAQVAVRGVRGSYLERSGPRAEHFVVRVIGPFLPGLAVVGPPFAVGLRVHKVRDHRRVPEVLARETAFTALTLSSA